MATAIAGVPTTIARADYVRLIESVGLPRDEIVSLTFYPDVIEAEVVARDEDGRLFTRGDGEIAMHHISIRVEED